MNPLEQPISDPQPPEVTPRPAQASEQTVFFDRQQDAALLREKVFSSRVTVLYGPAGAGKSFVLLKLFSTEVEKESACVIYFKDWHSDDPAAALKARFVAEAEKLQVPEPGAGRPSLTDLVRLLTVAAGRPVVLILDQFEEFFGLTNDSQEPLRRELATLVRTPDLNIRVLLSLQEEKEHLDALAAFQATIPHLLHSTYRFVPAPYVGMRPFMRGEEAIFFGRDRDAVMLRDKVLSAPLTILYGPMGVGKSSVLHLRLTPLLEKKGARVIYFDKWRKDPVELLRQHLAKVASLTLTDQEGKSRSLAELVRLMLEDDNRTVVLILDQFEEFFLEASFELVTALRDELAQLVNASNLDVRVLLSLREEHLASLEPFRSAILNLFQSTHRLEPLNCTKARKAIEGPARHFGAEYETARVKEVPAEPPGAPPEPGLVDILLTALQQKRESGKSGQPAPALDETAPIELPILQLVCEELWKETISREEKKKATKEPTELGPINISKRLYQDLGGKEEILKRYLLGVMPRKWRDQKITAKLMKPLAPSSRYKRAVSAKDLARETELPLDKIKPELERLSESKVGVLRWRTYGAGVVLYELCHDSFIDIITPWRDKILERAKLYCRIKWGAAACLVLALILAGGGYGGFKYWEYRNFEHNTEEVMSDPHNEKNVVTQFEDVTRFLLQKNGIRRFAFLKDFLNRYQVQLKELRDKKTTPEQLAKIQQLLTGHKTEPAQEKEILQEKISSKEDGEAPTIILQYSLPLNEVLFKQVWRLEAAGFTKKYGIPIPLKIKFEKSSQDQAASLSQEPPQSLSGSNEKVVLKIEGKDIEMSINPDELLKKEEVFVAIPFPELSPNAYKDERIRSRPSRIFWNGSTKALQKSRLFVQWKIKPRTSVSREKPILYISKYRSGLCRYGSTINV
jgi:Cdc6-like AAA superfamily ATPase